MSYYTRYEIRVDKPDLLPEIHILLQEKVRGEWLLKEDYICGPYDVNIYLSDLVDISTTYSDVLFTLDMSGEDHPDLSKAYILDGGYYTVEPKITYPKFDKGELVKLNKDGSYQIMFPELRKQIW